MNSPTSALETLKLFRIIFKSLTKHFHEVEKLVGLGGASLWAVAEISGNSNMTVSELAKAMSIHQSTASNLIDKLEIDGYVTRIKNTKDKRSVCLTLTTKGHEILQKAPPPYQGILPDALMKLHPEILVELHQNLTILVSKMQLTDTDSALEPLGKS
jgi:DNA-binding MarR family transcriptional regulator